MKQTNLRVKVTLKRSEDEKMNFTLGSDNLTLTASEEQLILFLSQNGKRKTLRKYLLTLLRQKHKVISESRFKYGTFRTIYDQLVL